MASHHPPINTLPPTSVALSTIVLQNRAYKLSHGRHFLGKVTLKCTHSPHNTLTLTVVQPAGSHCLVWDLRVINAAAVPIHRLLNPYALLPQIPTGTSHSTVLDLKDAFLTISLQEDSHSLLAFTWSILTWYSIPACLDWSSPGVPRQPPFFF